MKPYRDRGIGSLVLDVRIRSVGRIKRATGTNSAKTFEKIDRMVRALADQGRVDLLRALRGGVLAPRELLDAWRRNDLNALPTAKAARPLKATWNAWVRKKDCSDAHKLSLAQSLRHLKPKAETPIADVATLLEHARDRLAKHPQSFRLCRSAAQAFVKATLKRSHPLYADVQAVEPLKIREKRRKHPATVEELREIAKRATGDAEGDTSVAQIISTGSLTGMRVNELWGSWSVRGDRVAIHGTKTKNAERVVPLIGLVWKPTISYVAFRKALADASDGQMTPYDLRRTYANWLEAAGIPRTRRRLYLGHGASDVTDLYEHHEVDRFLAEDAAKLRAFLGDTQADQKLAVVW